jgi:hypothetical protein
MSSLTPGKKVRQVVPVIEGEVSDIRWNRDEKKFEVLVAYTSNDGPHERWFTEDQVAEVETPAESKE